MNNGNFTIPKEWTSVKLESLAKITNGKTNSQDAVEDGQYPLFDRSILIKKSNKYLFDAPAIILPGEGAEFIPRYYEGKFDLHQRAYAIFPGGKVKPRFLYYYIFANRKFFLKKSVGSTVKSLRLPIIKSFPVLVPTSKEQEKIVEVLSSVDEDIERTDVVIEKIEHLKKGLMQQLLTRGIGHTKFKETKIGEIPEEWKVVPFEQFATLQRGFDLPIQKRIKGEYPLVASNGIIDSHSSCKVKSPGVVTGRSGTIGAVFYVEKDFWPLNTTLYIKDFHGNYEKYVYYVLQKFNLNRFFSGTGVPTLNRNVVHKEKIAVPTVPEQRKISDLLTAIDNKIYINKNFKNKLLQLKKGLMSDLLSGKVRT